MMSGIRRWYIYLVSLISLQALTWAIISLLRNVFVYGRRNGISFETESLSWQIAIIIVTLPLFLVHWLWAQRLAQRDNEEQDAWVRGFYLYGIIASFLAPVVVNSYELLQLFLQLLLKVEPISRFRQLTPGNLALYHLFPILVLAALWFYHYYLAASGPRAANPLRAARGWYMFGFAAVGLAMTTIGAIALLRWLWLQIGDTAVINTNARLTTELARLFIGIPLWLLFWHWAQQLFVRSDENEQASTLRKFYLYLIVFVMALTAVAAATGIFAGILRRLLTLPPQGNLRDPIIYILVSATLWFYHARVLQQDIRASQELPQQATIRRLYWYLIAAVGLAAFLIGLGGDISVLIRSLNSTFITELREQLAWFTAALVAGLPVWLLPWRQAQTAAVAPGAVADDEREDVVRKIYLYFYIFVATMTVLASAVFIVYRLVSLMLGATSATNLGTELSHAIAYALIAVAVWLYHGAALRSDNRLTASPILPDSLRVAVVDGNNGRIGQPILTALQQALPFATLQAVGFQTDASNGHPPETILAEAELIISPWPMLQNEESVATAVAHSPARKLLIPIPQEGWEWVGVEPWNLENLVNETVRASRQIASGGTVRQRRPRSAGTVIGIIAGVIGLMIVMSIMFSFFFNYLF
jgi:hypothetical protein